MTAATIAGHSNKSEYSKKNGYRKSSKTPWGNPIVYFFSLVLVAICITPVLYIIFGGFRTNSQITQPSVRDAEPMGPRQLQDGLRK